MKDPTHLYEADKIRISNEAKVQTAKQDPDFAEKEFAKWREAHEARFLRTKQIEERDEQALFVNAWARRAWLSEGHMLTMGRELNKLQKRIGRQRVANRDLVKRNKELESFLELIESKLAQGIKEESWGSLSKTFLQDLYAKIRRA